MFQKLTNKMLKGHLAYLLVANDQNENILCHNQLLSMFWTLQSSTFWFADTNSVRSDNTEGLWEQDTACTSGALTHAALAVSRPTARYRSLPCAGRAARSVICSGFTAKPVAVKVGGGMVDRQALLVALADFGEDVDPVLGLHAVICLDVQDSSFRLDHLEHLQTQK